jgi:hypothetical protein
VLVGAVWAAAGVMYGLLAGVFAAGVCDPFQVSAAGGVLFAFAGGWLEAAG